MRTIAVLIALIIAALTQNDAKADRRVPCPFVANLEDGTFSKSSARYKCYASSTAAKTAGFLRDDKSSSSPVEFSGNGNFASAPFLMSGKATPVRFSCGATGYFGVKLISADTGRSIELLVNGVDVTIGATHSYAKGRVYLQIDTTSKCLWSVKIGG